MVFNLQCSCQLGWQSYKSELHMLPRCCCSPQMHTTLWNEDHTSDLRLWKKTKTKAAASTATSATWFDLQMGNVQRLSTAQQHLRTAPCPIATIRLRDTQIGIRHEEERLYRSAISPQKRFQSSVDAALVATTCGQIRCYMSVFQDNRYCEQ